MERSAHAVAAIAASLLAGIAMFAHAHAVRLLLSDAERLLRAISTFQASVIDEAAQDALSRRFFWVAEDVETHLPVLLETDSHLRGEYSVVESWSPRIIAGSRVPSAEWTRCFVDEMPSPPGPSSNVEQMALTRESRDLVRLDLTFDLDFSGEGPWRYRCGPTGPVWVLDG